jgi:tetratricopeptide (TPR) repeat protein
MSLQVVYDQARQALESNELDRAIGLAQHIIDHYPDNLEAYRILGEAYLANRQLDRAQESFDRVLRSDPENIPAHVGLGITSERQGQLDRAIGEFEQALEIKPDMTELRSQLLRLYAEGWGSENAQLRLSRAGLARLYAKGHMLPQAIAEFRQVLADQPGRHDALVALAEALWRDGQEDEATTLARDILAQRPESLKANLLLGYLLLSSGTPDGDRYWQAALRMDPYQTVARALFDTLPQEAGEEPVIEAWDEAAWRARRAAEQQEQIAATRPMEAVTPVGTAAGAATIDRLSASVSAAPPAPAAPSLQADDFLASLLALDAPPPPPPAPAALSDEDLDLDVDMQPFSLDDLDGTAQPPAARTPAAPEAPAAPAQADEPAMTPFSLGDLDLSDDEIAGLESANEAQPQPAADEPAMTPFSLSDLGLSEDEIAGLESANEAQPQPAADEPAMTPFSLSDLGLSEDEIAGLESANETQPQPAADEPAMTPFSLADLGLSDDEIAGIESLNQAQSPGAVPETAQPAADALAEDEPELTPFSLADLGLSEDEIAGLESLQTDAEAPSAPRAPAQPQPREPAPAADDDLADLGDLPIDLQPFSIDELDLGNDTGMTSAGGLPPSLQPFSLDETPMQRPRVSGFSSAESAESESENPGEEEDFASEARGFSWQQASQKSQPGFTKSLHQETQGEDASIFSKLRQQRASQGEQPEEPLPPVSLAEDEHLGLFSMDDISLRDDAQVHHPPAESPAAGGSAPAQPPAAPPEVESLEDALASGQVQPFSFSDLGLSEEEIAALGLGTPGATAPSGAEQARDAGAPAAPEQASAEHQGGQPAPAPEVESLEDALASGQVQPFSLADLGLSPEEIAALEGSGLDATPNFAQEADSVEPQKAASPEEALASEPVQPFSLDDLGMAEEDAAPAEGAASVAEPAEPAQPQGRQSTAPAEEEAALVSDLKPFSLADLGLSDEEISALGLGDVAETEESGEVGLALTEEELEGLDGGDLKWLQSPAASSSGAGQGAAPGAPEGGELAPQVTTGDLVVDRLIALGRQQGFVDISDIISNVEDPEAEADRIEEIGQRLHEARIEIRDGDEVIDMDADYEEETGEEQAEPAAPEPPAPRPSYPPRELDLAADEGTAGDEPAAPSGVEADQPNMTPFSLSELGLSDEEINSLGLGEAAAPEQPAEAGAQPPADEPDMTPFSLSDLGLSEDEIAALGLGEAPAPAQPEEPAAEPAVQTSETAPLGSDKPAASAQPEEPSPLPDLALPDMTPFSLNELGLSDEEISALGLGEAPAPPAEEAPAEPAAQASEPTAPPAEEAPAEPAPVAPPAAREEERQPFREAAPAPRQEVSTRDQAVPAPATAAATPQPAARDATGGGERAATGNDILDAFLEQLDAEPENDVLRLSVARVSGQIGLTDLAMQQYKYLIKHNRLLNDVVQELQELIDYSEDRQTLQRLHRTLGDVYSKQGKLREAVEAYSWRG